MTIVQIRNRGVRQLPEAMRRRRWADVGSMVFIAEGRQRLDVMSECQDGEPRTLLLVLTTASERHEIRTPEDLCFYTTEALVRAVEYDAGGITRVLFDIGELVTAPKLAVMP